MFEQFMDSLDEDCNEDSGSDFETSDEILSIHQIKERIIPVCIEYGINIVYIFGSYSRSEATKESDVDLLVESSKNPSLDSLLKVCAFENSLKDALKKEVQVITHIPLDKHSTIFKNNLMKDMVLLYERQ